MVVPEGPALNVQYFPSNTYCIVNNGSISAAPVNGHSPYTFSLDNIHFQANAVFNNLGAGNYTVYTKDSVGCTNQGNVTIQNYGGNPDTASFSISSTDANNFCSSFSSVQVYGTTSYYGDNIDYDVYINDTLKLSGGASSHFQPAINLSLYNLHLNDRIYVVMRFPSTHCQPYVYDTSNVIVVRPFVANGGPDKLVCTSGGSTNIGLPAETNFSYSWSSVPVGFTSSVANPVVQPTVPTTYILTSTYSTNFGNYCVSTDTVKVNFENSWTGSVSTVWENPANWSCNVLPDSTTKVHINSGLVNYPVISSNPVVGSMDIQPGASVLVKTGYSLALINH